MAEAIRQNATNAMSTRSMVAPSVSNVGARGHRCGEDQDVLDPLPGRNAFWSGRQVFRRAELGPCSIGSSLIEMLVSPMPATVRAIHRWVCLSAFGARVTRWAHPIGQTVCHLRPRPLR